jgi:hypothetical protein
VTYAGMQRVHLVPNQTYPDGHFLHGWGTLSFDGVTGKIAFNALLYFQFHRRPEVTKGLTAPDPQKPATDIAERMHYAFMQQLNHLLLGDGVYPA